MARYRDDRDDEDEEEDDRPRRRKRSRRDDDPPPKSNLPVILLVVGLAVGLPVLGCVGFGVWFFFQAKKGFDQFTSTLQSEMAATNFLTTLESGNVRAAYDSTTPQFKKTTTFEQFDRLVKQHPVLTSSHTPNQSGIPTPTGTAPNRTVVLSFTLTPNRFNDPGDLGDPGDGLATRPTRGTAPRLPTNPKPPSTAPAPKGATCTLTLVEQADGTWKVDGFTVP